jgi:hypothetical protein
MGNEGSLNANLLTDSCKPATAAQSEFGHGIHDFIVACSADVEIAANRGRGDPKPQVVEHAGASALARQ